jgi:plastocyanin
MTLWLALLFSVIGPTTPTTHTVEIRGMEFHPAALTVAVGDTVVWINRDIVPHTATATGRAKAWDTGQLLQGQVGRYVAVRTGSLRYSCTYHPTMHGTITIHKVKSS